MTDSNIDNGNAIDDQVLDQVQALEHQLEIAAKMGLDLYEEAEASNAKLLAAEAAQIETLNYCSELRNELALVQSERDRLRRKTNLLSECLDDLEQSHDKQQQRLEENDLTIEKQLNELQLQTEKTNEADYHNEGLKEKQAAMAWRLAISKRNTETSEQCRQLKQQVAQYNIDIKQSRSNIKKMQQQLNASIFTCRQQKKHIAVLKSQGQEQNKIKHRQRRMSLIGNVKAPQKKGHRSSLVGLNATKSFAKLLAMHRRTHPVPPAPLVPVIEERGEEEEEEEEGNEAATTITDSELDTMLTTVPSLPSVKDTALGEKLSDLHIVHQTTSTTPPLTSKEILSLDHDIIALEIKKTMYTLDSKHQALVEHVGASSETDQHRSVTVAKDIEDLKLAIARLRLVQTEKHAEYEAFVRQQTPSPLPVWDKDVREKVNKKEERRDCECAIM